MENKKYTQKKEEARKELIEQLLLNKMTLELDLEFFEEAEKEEGVTFGQVKRQHQSKIEHLEKNIAFHQMRLEENKKA